MALTLPGCGSQAPAAPGPTTEKTTTAAQPATATGKPATAAASCASGLGSFLGQLEHLRRSLVIGVSYEQYVSELGTVRKSYERVPVGKLDLACVSGAAASAEAAFDGYLAAANTWGKCVAEAGCETAALEPKLRHKWKAAASLLAEAKEALGPS